MYRTWLDRKDIPAQTNIPQGSCRWSPHWLTQHTGKGYREVVADYICFSLQPFDRSHWKQSDKFKQVELSGIVPPIQSDSEVFAPNLFSGILLPDVHMHSQAFTFRNHRFSRKALYLRCARVPVSIHTCKWTHIRAHTRKIFQNVLSCLPFVDDSVIVKGNSPEMLHRSMKVHISSVLLRKAWSFLWFLNLVLHIWCCTVFICLFSFF